MHCLRSKHQSLLMSRRMIMYLGVVKLNKRNYIVACVCAALVGLAMGVNAQPLADKSEVVVLDDVKQRVLTRLKSSRPELKLTELKSSPMKGVYEVKVNGQVAFVSEDGGHLIAGEMYEVREGALVNLQEQQRQEQEKAFEPQRAKMLSAVNKEDMVIYSPEKEAKAFVYVFTDIDCGYCRKLHSQLEGFMDKGIEIRYLAFPRAGAMSNSAKKLASVWCSDDALSLMTRYKRGESIPVAACDDAPIGDQLMLGQQVGVRGTPAIVTSTGQLIPGAVSPDYLAQTLGL